MFPACAGNMLPTNIHGKFTVILGLHENVRLTFSILFYFTCSVQKTYFLEEIFSQCKFEQYFLHCEHVYPTKNVGKSTIYM